MYARHPSGLPGAVAGRYVRWCRSGAIHRLRTRNGTVSACQDRSFERVSAAFDPDLGVVDLDHADQELQVGFPERNWSGRQVLTVRPNCSSNAGRSGSHAMSATWRVREQPWRGPDRPSTSSGDLLGRRPFRASAARPMREISFAPDSRNLAADFWERRVGFLIDCPVILSTYADRPFAPQQHL